MNFVGINFPSIVFAAFFISACDTPQEKLAKLEESGEIPKLERTTTLTGLDENSNGIRDDVEAYIDGHYSQSEQNKAIRQLAINLQSTLTVDLADDSAVKALSLSVARATHCAFDKFTGDSGQGASVATQQIESITTNTKTRLVAYLAYNKALDGKVISLPKGDTCDE